MANPPIKVPVGERISFPIATILRMIVGLSGAAAVAYGSWLVAPWAGYIVGGTLALAGVIADAWIDQNTSGVPSSFSSSYDERAS